MRSFTHIETQLEEKKFIDASHEIVTIIHDIKAKKSFSYVKMYLDGISCEDDFYALIRLLDECYMYQYSAFLVRYAYARFQTPRTLSWLCEELLSERKPLDAEELLLKALNDASDQDKGRLHVTLAKCLLDMYRYNEALLHLQRAEGYGPVSDDRWGYYHMQRGDWEEAEAFFLRGTQGGDRADVCWYFLAHLYAAKGEHARSLQLLEEGIIKYPQVPALQMERIRRLRELKQYDKLLEELNHFDQKLPLHVYKAYFADMRAHVYYEQQKESHLINLLQTVPSLKTSPYQRIVTTPEGKNVKLPVTAVLQKDNYCVPASMEMMLRLFGETKNQDEIGAHIFDQSGSKLSEAVAYGESLGFVCRYFTGEVALYKQLLDAGIPILMTVDFEQAAHVQVVMGYDERLQSFYVHDTNSLDPFLLTYENFRQQHINTHYLSIVCIPCHQKQIADILPSSDDSYFRQLFSILDDVEKHPLTFSELVLFLNRHRDIPYTWLYVLKVFGADDDKILIEYCIDRATTAYPNVNYINMHAAHCLVRIDEKERAYHMLKRVTKKTHSPMYHFVLGRIRLDEERYEEAVTHFRTSLQLDPDQPAAWSYMALSYLYQEQHDKALLCSTIARERAETRFVLVNHGLVLMDMECFQEAYDIFDKLVQEDRRDAYVWYERARCARNIGKLHLAVRGFTVVKELEPMMPYSYLQLSELYELEYGDEEKAVSILKEGIAKKEDLLLCERLADFYYERNQLEAAEDMYQAALTHNPNHMFSHVGLVNVYMRKNARKGKEYLFAIYPQFKTEGDFLLNAGKTLWDYATQEDEAEEALSMIERGMCFISTKEAIDMYVSCIQNTWYIQRGIQFLHKLLDKEPDHIILLCSIGVLYEQQTQYTKAIAQYETALHIKEDFLPYYRLGETYEAMHEWERARTYYEKCLAFDDVSTVHVKLAELYHLEENEEREWHHMLQAVKQDPLRMNMEYLASMATTSRRHKELLDVLQTMDNVPENWRMDSLAYLYGAIGNAAQEESYLQQAFALDEQQAEVMQHYAMFLVQKQHKKASNIIAELIKTQVHHEGLYTPYLQAMKQGKGFLYVSSMLQKLSLSAEDKSYAFMYAATAMEPFLMQQQEGDTSGWKKALKKIASFTKHLLSVGTVIDLYETALKLYPNNHDAAQRFANFYENANLTDDAANTLRQALQKSWNYETGYQLAALLLHHANSEDMLEEALHLSQQLLQEQPVDSLLWRLHAYILADLDREEAEHIFLRLVEQIPTSEHYLALARLYNENERYEEAVTLIRKGLKQHAADGLLHVEMSIAQHQLGFTLEALKQMDQLLSVDADDLMGRYHRARYLAALHRVEEAREELARVLADDESGYFESLAEHDPELHVLSIQQM
ncbi:tetratricopeptide repeat protein [Ectobacillus sp. JY-23]|uniref:tetratricopeptide repeat protein n=1 Tax=Ectobacillus sp. JY-23 TaxID=2933872 RepID=UPI001FF2A6DD|nr:tetratricopeptide repeat protein [Ectobacillus sp. JY-23]UOY92966.1 tetratricopeptide repeat protein [Ectobacillus sp. JY-23]